jgi:hypothetical protein
MAVGDGGSFRALTGGVSTRQDRRVVLWIGGEVPAALASACVPRGLELRRITRDRLPEVAPQARILVLEVDSVDEAFVDWGPRVVGGALQHGLLVGLVQPAPEVGPPVLCEMSELMRFYKLAEEVKSDPRRVLALYRKWENVAQWAEDHDPGRGENQMLRLEGEVPVNSATAALFRRAFSDYSAVTLESLGGGRSGAQVWRVRTADENPSSSMQSYVAKVHDLQKMLLERSNMNLIKGAVSWRLRPNLHQDRCVEGNNQGLAVYDVVDEAITFANALRCGRQATLVASLFEETLKECRRSHFIVNGSIATVLEKRLGVLRWTSDLEAAAAEARQRLPRIGGVAELRDRLSSLPKVEYREGTIHGDLHIGNLFVPAGSTEVILIDFGRVATSAPLVVDPACLEVSLTFPPRDKGAAHPHQVAPEWLRAAYDYPVLRAPVPQLPRKSEWVSSAVSAIRSQGLLNEPSHVGYAVAVASQLVRFASYETNADVEVRGFAYELAWMLIEGVGGERAPAVRGHAA